MSSAAEVIGDENGEIPDWSGVFFEFEGEGLGMMMVSNLDEQQHRPPFGWVPTHHSTSEHGEFEVYTYRLADL